MNGTIYHESTIVPFVSVTQGRNLEVVYAKGADQNEETAQNVAISLKDAEQKFSGDLVECW